MYWLYPFRAYKTFCPYLVGGYDEVADVLARYVALGVGVIILDELAEEDDLHHSMRAIERAERRAGGAASAALRPGPPAPTDIRPPDDAAGRRGPPVRPRPPEPRTLRSVDMEHAPDAPARALPPALRRRLAATATRTRTAGHPRGARPTGLQPPPRSPTSSGGPRRRGRAVTWCRCRSLPRRRGGWPSWRRGSRTAAGPARGRGRGRRRRVRRAPGPARHDTRPVPGGHGLLPCPSRTSRTRRARTC
ncbi:hypothetical protein NKH77_44580 [Streptomyces sp. M19]